MDRVLNRKDRRARLASARRDPNQWTFQSRPNAAAVFSVAQSQWGECLGAYVSPLYSVQVYERDTAWGTVLHLSIRRHDGKTDVPWSHKQRIKDQLVGRHRTAIEVFPAAAELTDDANLYHLWVLPEGFELPFALETNRGGG